MFGIADFNRQVMENPELLAAILEDEEEEYSYCYISPQDYFDDGGAWFGDLMFFFAGIFMWFLGAVFGAAERLCAWLQGRE